MNPVVLNLRIRQGINAAGEYGTFIGKLRDKLAHHPLRQDYIDLYGAWLTEHPLLPVQQPIQPLRWIHINLIVQDEDGHEQMRTTIAVRDDNVFFQGFRNKHGQWYEFGINDEKNVRFIAGSTFLGCDVGYPGLVGGAENLHVLALTKEDAVRAVRMLSEYHQVAPARANSEAKHHLARICVMICESARMTPMYDRVSARWDSALGNVPPVDDDVERTRIAKYTTNWSKMSSRLLSMLDPSPERTSLLAVVHLLFNKIKSQAGQHQQKKAPSGGGSGQQEESGSSNPQGPETSSLPPASGSSGGSRAQEQKGQTGGKSVRTQPLVQVYSVQVYSRDVVGTIVVFDGKRGQIIYNHRSQGRNNYGNELPLTGPYKAISAEGSFAIQVHGILSGTDVSEEESSNVIGEMLWDCYADNVEYDKELRGYIIGTGNGGVRGRSLAMVRYLVWSDAVEATVEVSLLLPGITRVFGMIRARYESVGYEELLLFNRERDEEVELVPSSAGSMVPLELGRSVIAVPLLGRYSRVMIDVYLHVATPNKEGDVPLLGDISINLDKHTGEIRINQFGDFLVPVGWTAGSDPKGVAPSLGSQGVPTSASPQTSEQQVKVQVNITSPGFHVSPLKPESYEHRMDPTVVELNFDLDADYGEFISCLRAVLADHPHRDNYISTYGDWLRDHPLLSVQQPIAPARCIHVNLLVQGEEGVGTMGTTIAIRGDNVYFMGFKNRNGDWYEFGTEGRSFRFFAGSTFLGCDFDYGGLIGGRENFVEISLGKYAAVRAVRRLWAYEHVGVVDKATRRDLACLSLMICEAARMTPYYETVRHGWNNIHGSRINPLHVRYIYEWAQMSRTLLNYGDRYPKNLDRQGALAVVVLILNKETSGGRQRHQQQNFQTPGVDGSSQQGSSGDPRPPSPASSRRASSVG